MPGIHACSQRSSVRNVSASPMRRMPLLRETASKKKPGD